MANSYSQISIQAVFAVRRRANLIGKEWREELYRYISGILTNEKCFSLAVGGWKDHIHIFFGMPVTKCVADILRVVKANSSKWINEQKKIQGRFEWQSGYGAFSYSKDQRDRVIKYIMNQEAHHTQKTFKDEYLQLLQQFGVEYDHEYVFEFYE
jgi:putative transposase